MSRFDEGKGFTLIEVLIALSILALIMGMVYGSFVQSRWALARSEEAVADQREVRAVFLNLQKDLTAAFLSASQEDRTVFVGTEEYRDGRAADRLDFTTFAHRRRWEEGPEADQAVVGYFLEEGEGSLQVLFRREKVPLDEDPFQGGEVLPVATRVVSLDFRFRERDAWRETWDSRVEGRLPEAVWVTLVTRDHRGRDHPWHLVIPLMLAR